MNYEELTIRSFPYQVHILQKKLKYEEHHVCVGAMITQMHILAAAHCIIFPNNPNIYSVIPASIVIGDPSKTRSVHKIYIHQDFGIYKNGIANDILIILLEKPFDYIANKQRPIETAKYLDESAVGEYAVISGWGVTEYGSGKYELKAGRIPIVSLKYCKLRYTILPKRVLCAGYDKLGKADNCGTDSGALLVYNEQLIGISSYGIKCSRGGYPGVYTLIPEFIPWINEVIELTRGYVNSFIE